jgi:hypothetical protein
MPRDYACGKPNGSHRAATAGRVALGLVISLILECVTVQELRSCSGNGVRKARKIGGWLSALHNSSRTAVRLLPKQSLIFRRNLVRAPAFHTPPADLQIPMISAGHSGLMSATCSD